MPLYKVWYKKEVKAKNLKEAVLKEKRVKSAFFSIEKEEEKDVEQGASCIGFQSYDPEQDDY